MTITIKPRTKISNSKAMTLVKAAIMLTEFAQDSDNEKAVELLKQAEVSLTEALNVLTTES